MNSCVSLHNLNNSALFLFSIYILSLFFFSFLGLHLQHVEVPRLRVESELQLPAYNTATATPDLSHICKSSGQYQILNPLSEARDLTRILMDTSWVHYG